LAALSQQPILSQTAAAPGTLLLIAQALTKSGNPKAVVHLLELQIKLQPPSTDLYRTLADACEATGDKARAHDLRTLAAGTN
jgi:predicted Zn-dependent protease